MKEDAKLGRILEG